MRSIAWLSEKGGTSKTTSAVNTAVGLAKANHRTLVIDADPQGNASMVFLKGESPGALSLAHVLMEDVDPLAVIVPTDTPNLELLPADVSLADANVALAGEIGRERRLRLALDKIGERYDYIVVDTSPQRSLLTVNTLNAVEEVLCPVDPGIFSLAGLGKLQQAIGEVVRYLDNPALRLAGLLLTRTTRDNLSRDVEARLREMFGPLVFDTTIPTSSKIGEATSRWQSVLDYAPRSSGAVAYQNLVVEIIRRGQNDRLGVDPVRTAQTHDEAGAGTRRAARGDHRAAG
jgi:chromosome partitioning protein